MYPNHQQIYNDFQLRYLDRLTHLYHIAQKHNEYSEADDIMNRITKVCDVLESDLQIVK